MSGEPSIRPSQVDALELARSAAHLADDKKAEDVVALDLRGLANFTDFFVICSGRTDRQVKAIHDAVREGIKEQFGLLPDRTEGEAERAWLLLDYGDCVVHIMLPDVRGFYRLEQLWQDAKEVELGLPAPPAQPVVGGG